MSTPTGQFKISNGQIIGPDGSQFVARGIDVMETGPSAATLQQDFPGINFVRLAIYDFASAASLQPYVTDLTSHGIVVELEDHTTSTGSNAGGSSGQIFTGQALINELNWYSATAAAFKGNPLVWFGTNNEPSETDSSGTFNPGALSDWQKATYDAIRNAGNNSPILLEANGWSNNGQPVMLQGYKASDYAAMTNTIWDIHDYGWLTNYSTDQTTNNNFLSQMVQQVQQVTNANGKMAVLVGEYGNSTTGQSLDANGDQVISAVLNAGVNTGLSTVAWAWGQGNPGDGLTTASGSLSAYGQTVAAGIKAIAARYPSSNTTATTSGTSTSTGSGATASTGTSSGTSATASASGTVVKAGATTAIVDASGNKWTITAGGQIAVNGVADTTTANVTELAYVNGTIWQENASNLWWGKTSPTASWSPSAGTSTSPLPAVATPSSTIIGSGSDTILLTVSEDADGPVGAAGRDAEFTVNVDGQQIGGLQTVTASHSAGQTQTFTFQGNYAPGAHTITVTFANNSMTAGDKAAFNDGGDRNLYVNGVSYDGQTVSSTVTGVYESGLTSGAHAVYTVTDATAVPANAPSTPSTTPSAVSVGTGADTLALRMSEDPYNGDAQFTVLVDGKQVGGTLATQAVEWQGQVQEFDLRGTWGNGPHTVAINYLNDAIGPADAAGGYDPVDRNLFVNSVAYDGATVTTTPQGLYNNGTLTYSVPSTAPATPATSTLTLRVSEDAYQGDAQFTVKVDGTQVGGTMHASALHATGDDSIVTLIGAWAAGQHQVAISFINDLYGGTASTDRNLYVDSIAYNGTTQGGSSATMMGNGTSTFTVGSTAATTGGPADTVTLHLSEDAWNGNAQFVLLIDGKVITTAQDVVASHASGGWQDLSFSGNFGAGTHSIGVQFTNDAYGGTTTTDRNLYVNGIDVNGTHYGSGVSSMMSNGTTNFTITTTH